MNEPCSMCTLIHKVLNSKSVLDDNAISAIYSHLAIEHNWISDQELFAYYK